MPYVNFAVDRGDGVWWNARLNCVGSRLCDGRDLCKQKMQGLAELVWYAKVRIVVGLIDVRVRCEVCDKIDPATRAGVVAVLAIFSTPAVKCGLFPLTPKLS